MRRVLVLLPLLALACGEAAVDGTPPRVPLTTLTPPPGPFNDAVTVTLSTDVPATITFTTDGTDPTRGSTTARTAQAPFTVTFDRTSTLTYFASANGVNEIVHAVQYFRAGGAKGAASGVVVVDSIALGRKLGLEVDGEIVPLATRTEAGEIPFEVKGLATGSHRIRAIADRNGDGEFVAFLDDASAPYDFVLVVEDPFRSSVENIRLMLGASPDGLCTLTGKINVPRPATGQLVRMSALGGGAFGGIIGGGGGGGADPASLLGQLQNGYQVFPTEGTNDYPYAITGLEPGPYIGVPLLTSFGVGGISLNLIANPLQPVECPAGRTVVQDHAFGPVGVSGTITYTPPEAVTSPVTYGIVAARNASLFDGIQVVLMPVIFVGLGQQENAVLTGSYAGQGLRANAAFHMKVFVPKDGSQPIADALRWAIDPTQPGQLSPPLRTTSADVVQDFAAP